MITSGALEFSFCFSGPCDFDKVKKENYQVVLGGVLKTNFIFRIHCPQEL